MNTPESIVVSLEWAKKLKEAGWPQNNFLTHEQPDHRPIFAWYSVKPDHDKDMYLEFCEEESNYGYRMYSAPTVSEIIRRIPVADRIAVPADRLDDPDSWAEIYCALQHTDLR